MKRKEKKIKEKEKKGNGRKGRIDPGLVRGIGATQFLARYPHIYGTYPFCL